ncbi:SDR family oxidoreductase [Rhodococcus sp. 5G237]
MKARGQGCQGCSRSLRVPAHRGRADVNEGLVATCSRHVSVPQLGCPDDIAAVVVFLASDAWRAINGALIPIDGGLSARHPAVVDIHVLT